ncbi:DUF1778 domain-containing protein [Methylotuvimicrobium sp.]|jgi:uncharacterized protein (DUF1778 family)|uniref:type II toxin-antitoxin system TacA family antitoxin n=1 Tax=Methylotuvimicrobium sp. TaxID=2822413 RepID=UPI003D662A45
MAIANNERITARVSEQIKETLIAAADLTGATLNQFLVQAALEKAERVIEKDKLIHLSQQDAEFFFDVLDNPPEPNNKLINAVKNYKARIK